MDINIPEHITDPDPKLDIATQPPPMPYTTTPKTSDYMSNEAKIHAQTLATYLWTNYIEPSTASKIIFMGLGHAFLPVARLLTTIMDIQSRISGVVVAIAKESARPIYSQDNEGLSRWYHHHSLVLVSKTHNIWAKEQEQRMKNKVLKRFGKLVRCEELNVSSILATHRDEVIEFVREMCDLVAEDEDQAIQGDLVGQRPPVAPMLGQEDTIMSIERDG